jgi:hypothetical protein
VPPLTEQEEKLKKDYEEFRAKIEKDQKNELPQPLKNTPNLLNELFKSSIQSDMNKI